jgi:serine/threonine protein kinase
MREARNMNGQISNRPAHGSATDAADFVAVSDSQKALQQLLTSSIVLILGNFRILDRIGAGGMGIVFKAEHLDMRRHVAIKVLPESSNQDDRVLRRFYNEMRAVAQLMHPNTVAALDAGKDQNPDGRPRGASLLRDGIRTRSGLGRI